MTECCTQVAIIGAGITGIATAYYLVTQQNISDVLLIDAGQPMAFTSAQSGENYRNWWPHPTMVSFTNRSIDLMEQIAQASGNQINMKRRGYALSTRASNIDELLAQLHTGLGDTAGDLLRFHDQASSASYQPPLDADWTRAPVGVDILHNQDLIQSVFPSYDRNVQAVVHIRRGGDISGQQLGMFMLDAVREAGGEQLTGAVEDISHSDRFRLEVTTSGETVIVHADQVVNAAGPFAGKIAKMLGVDLPVHNTLQQKIAFEDAAGAIPRQMPFSIDLDPQVIDWTDEERGLLLAEPGFAWLAQTMPGSIHCRPDGGDDGTWVKLGWAYNDKPETETWDPPLDDQFPEIVLRGAARLNPALKTYYGQLPRGTHHYGGWYTMTKENWPLVGPLGASGPEGAFMNCAMSGFGTMAACAAGELCAAWVGGSQLPAYATALSAGRYEDAELMRTLDNSNKGVL